MKKWVIYLLGIFTGAILMVIIAIIAVKIEDQKLAPTNTEDVVSENEIMTNSRIAYQEPPEIPGEVVNEKSFKVLQADYFNSALVHGKDEYGNYYGMLYYLYDYHLERDLYDDQIIKVPKGMEVRVFGVHRYTTRDGRYKTVPKIKIIPKQ